RALMTGCVALTHRACARRTHAAPIDGHGTGGRVQFLCVDRGAECLFPPSGSARTPAGRGGTEAVAAWTALIRHQRRDRRLEETGPVPMETTVATKKPK